MTEAEFDAVYTLLCKTMAQAGDDGCPLFLARFAMLAIDHIDDAGAVRRMIADASEGLEGVFREGEA